MTPLTCGTGGSTGLEIVTRINEVSQLTPRATLRTASTMSQTIDDSAPTKLLIFDGEVTSRNGFKADASTSELIVETGNYESVIVSIGLNVTFPGSESMQIWAYVNDTPYSPYEFVIRGRGDAKPVMAFWQSDVALSEGDKVSLWAQSISGSIDVTFIRSQFRIDADHREILP